MKLHVLEPLGIPQERLVKMAEESVGNRMEVKCFDTRVEDAKSLVERSKDADVVVLSNFKYSEEVMKHCPHLKMICVAFTGIDHIDMDYCRQRGIVVCNCSGYATVAVAELVFGLILNLYRRIGQCDEAVRKEGTKAGLVGFELEGKTFGIAGYGSIGKKIAGIARAFGCKVAAYDCYKIEDDMVLQMSLEELLAKSDILSLNVPLTPETKELIGKEQLALMKESAILINMARGPVVDSQALADALNHGKIAGAGIDVFEAEPPIPADHPLFSAKNLIATPHVAFATSESMVKRAELVFHNINAWLDDAPINVID